MLLCLHVWFYVVVVVNDAAAAAVVLVDILLLFLFIMFVLTETSFKCISICVIQTLSDSWVDSLNESGQHAQLILK